MQEKRNLWKILVGAILVVVTTNTLPLYLGGGTQANTGLAISLVAIVVGLYLIYTGFFPRSR
jgi:hypothetical protein